MGKKVLFTATVDSHILNFHLPYLKWFKEQGYEVHVASNGSSDIPYVDKKYNMPFDRSPFKVTNLKVFFLLRKIINKNNYELIHCHTPMGSVITRLSAIKARHKGTKVIYTAHGFHFYNGASLVNWALYYPIEKWLSNYTDCLITINEEDYRNINKKNFKCEQMKLVNGVGVDLDRFTPKNSMLNAIRRENYGYQKEDFILFFAAELNYNKHQDFLINAVNVLKNKIPKIKLLLAGVGELTNQYKDLVNELGLNDSIHFLGFRKDIDALMTISDIAVSSSRREGLPLNIMEAMATGLPLVVTNCRGNRDLVRNNVNGFVVDIDDLQTFVTSIEKIYRTEAKQEFGKKNLEFVRNYSLESVSKEMFGIYLNFLK